MIAVPAVDVRRGRCVQLVGGLPERERISLPDPVASALHWWHLGFRHLHVVDLDAALSQGDNRALLGTIVSGTPAEVQVGGGIRDTPGVDALLGMGFRRVIVGTRALDDPDWLESVAQKYPDRLMVATDIRDGQVLRKGWTESTGLTIQNVLGAMDSLPLAGVLCTDVAREGRVSGIDVSVAEAVIEGTRHPVWIAGGITTMDELRALRAAGAAGAIMGMALYTGTLDAEEVAKEFGE